jgi:hypothetical protein
MKKNCLIQLRIETNLLEKLRKQANESGTTISDLCRQKIEAPSLLIKIDEKLEFIKKRLSEDMSQ